MKNGLVDSMWPTLTLYADDDVENTLELMTLLRATQPERVRREPLIAQGAGPAAPRRKPKGYIK